MSSPSPRPRAVPEQSGICVGISGAPESAHRPGSAAAVARCRELGIAALEMAWVHRVTIKRPAARKVRQAASRHAVRLSVHAPYYINLNSRAPDKVTASIERIVAAGRAASWCGARDVALHLAYYHSDGRAVVMRRVVERLAAARSRLGDSAAEVVLRPETMGRRSQFGSLEEVLRLCQAVPGTAPCLDIAHLHARTGGCNSAAQFDALWDEVRDALGASALESVHVHISGIEYGPAGEIRHCALEESDLDYRACVGVMLDRRVMGLLIVESPAREADVLRVADVISNLAAAAS